MNTNSCESWDSDDYPSYNPLEDIHTKNILRSAFSVIGKSKKAKRAFRLAERERLSNKLDEEEKKFQKLEIENAEKNLKPPIGSKGASSTHHGD